MSRIEKLSIQGIRSFGPQNREAIQFNTPLTLIVGYNGSGKTTIIECLKYATTGELPPNSKGGAFIHDPKLCGEKEVLAQVKLAFRNTTGEKHVVTRSLQLTVKKTTRTQKTLEGSLVCNNNGERTTVSTRVADLDEQVPQFLGVSQAILDAVIFCHQDESLWPMTEPSALKKRFDEIFEALRYTKAIENLKLLRKKQGEELTRLKIFEEQDKINKEKGDKAEKRSLELQAEIEKAREKCGEITKEMAEVQELIDQKTEEATIVKSTVNNLGNMRNELELRQSTVADIRLTLVELPEDDEHLQTTLAQAEERMARSQEEADQNKLQYAELQKELAKSRRDLASKLAEQGKHESDKDKYERQIKTRAEMIQEAARVHGFRGYEEDINESHVNSFNDRIQKLLAEKKRDLDRLQKENSIELDKATAVITELEGRKAARTQDRVFAKQRIGAIEKRISVLQNDINLQDADEGAKALLDSQAEDVDARKSRVIGDIESGNFDIQLQQENEKLWQLESENDRLGGELVECTRLASERAQLDLRKKEMMDRKRKLDTITSTWKDKLNAIVGGTWNSESLETDFQGVLKKQNKAVAAVLQMRDGAREKQQAIDFKLMNARHTLKEKTDEAAQCKNVVLDVVHAVREDATIDDYLDEVKFVEEDVETYKSDLSLFDALTKYYDDARKTLELHNKCMMCDRSFEKDHAAIRSRLLQKIQKQLNPSKKNLTQEDLVKSQQTLEKLQSVRIHYDSYQRLTDELPPINQEIKSLESEHDAQERQLESHDADVVAEEEKLKDMEGMNKTVLTISQTVRDIKESEAQIERIQSQQISGAASRSVDEIHGLQAACAEQLRNVKGRINKLSADRQRLRDQLNALELEKSELKNKITNAARQLERKKDFQTQIQTLKEEHVHQRELIQKADEDLEAVEPQVSEARSIRADILQRGRSKEQAVADERDKVASSLSELKMVESEIQDYKDRGGLANLAANQRAIVGLERIITGTEKEIADLTVRTNKLKQDIDNSDRNKRNINDNLSYRKNLRIVEVLRGEIEELESRNADEEYERLTAETKRLLERQSKLNAERGSVMGSMKRTDQELERLLAEWEMDYKNAARKYRESHIRVETTKAAIEDLGRYSSALDKAIMQYHSLKMEEVNRIAGELWQSTYQGTDIDTILIRSDAETATGKRNYNYRVCMVKQDTEMDMRGRCSAGQKVLASIIIRLALAESFGINCGLIALDEPTTNLDKDNIKSLAESLHAIIKARQQQSNFQLIVITHDEEFLRHMRCNEFCDTFFRVRRDDKQNSVITRESITKVI